MNRWFAGPGAAIRYWSIGLSVALTLVTGVSSHAAAPPRSAQYVGNSSLVEGGAPPIAVCNEAGLGVVCLRPFALGDQKLKIRDNVATKVRVRYEVLLAEGVGEEPLQAGTFCDEVLFNIDQADVLVHVWILDGPGPECPDADPGVIGSVTLLSLSPGVG